MRSIAIMNQKGGVGKTTTAVNVSAALASGGHNVCLVDLDPQAHASLHLGISPADGELTVYDVLAEGVEAARVLRRVSDHLHVLPSHLDLAAAELELADHPRRERVLHDQLEPESTRFEFCLIDCPPSLGVLTLNALTAVDEVLLPLQPHFLALHGLSKLLKTIELVSQRLNPRLRLGGVVLCMYEAGTRLAAEVSSDVEAFFANQTDPESAWSQSVLFSTRIRRNIRLAEAPSHGQSIFDYAPHSHGAVDYRRLAEEIATSKAARARLAA